MQRPPTPGVSTEEGKGPMGTPQSRPSSQQEGTVSAKQVFKLLGTPARASLLRIPFVEFKEFAWVRGAPLKAVVVTSTGLDLCPKICPPPPPKRKRRNSPRPIHGLSGSSNVPKSYEAVDSSISSGRGTQKIRGLHSVDQVTRGSSTPLAGRARRLTMERASIIPTQTEFQDPDTITMTDSTKNTHEGPFENLRFGRRSYSFDSMGGKHEGEIKGARRSFGGRSKVSEPQSSNSQPGKRLNDRESIIFHGGKDAEAQRRTREFGGPTMRIALDAEEVLGKPPTRQLMHEPRETSSSLAALADTSKINTQEVTSSTATNSEDESQSSSSITPPQRFPPRTSSLPNSPQNAENGSSGAPAGMAKSDKQAPTVSRFARSTASSEARALPSALPVDHGNHTSTPSRLATLTQSNKNANRDSKSTLGKKRNGALDTLRKAGKGLFRHRKSLTSSTPAPIASQELALTTSANVVTNRSAQTPQLLGPLSELPSTASTVSSRSQDAIPDQSIQPATQPLREPLLFVQDQPANLNQQHDEHMLNNNSSGILVSTNDVFTTTSSYQTLRLFPEPLSSINSSPYTFQDPRAIRANADSIRPQNSIAVVDDSGYTIQSELSPLEQHRRRQAERNREAFRERVYVDRSDPHQRPTDAPSNTSARSQKHGHEESTPNLSLARGSSRASYIPGPSHRYKPASPKHEQPLKIDTIGSSSDNLNKQKGKEQSSQATTDGSTSRGTKQRQGVTQNSAFSSSRNFSKQEKNREGAQSISKTPTTENNNQRYPSMMHIARSASNSASKGEQRKSTKNVGHGHTTNIKRQIRPSKVNVSGPTSKNVSRTSGRKLDTQLVKDSHSTEDKRKEDDDRREGIKVDAAFDDFSVALQPGSDVNRNQDQVAASQMNSPLDQAVEACIKPSQPNVAHSRADQDTARGEVDRQVEELIRDQPPNDALIHSQDMIQYMIELGSRTTNPVARNAILSLLRSTGKSLIDVRGGYIDAIERLNAAERAISRFHRNNFDVLVRVNDIYQHDKIAHPDQHAALEAERQRRSQEEGGD